MSKFNFTVNGVDVYDLALDLARNEYSLHSAEGEVTKKDLEKQLRDTINNDILKGASLYQAYRRNNILIFEIVEEIVNTEISENILSSAFMEAFVEVKNRYLGDKTEFYSEGGLLSVATFAGNHWDTNRQAIDAGESISLPREWAFIHVYEELERFLLGITTLEKLNDKIYKSINKFFQDRIYAQFQNVADAVPVEFNVSGNSEESVGELCDKVQAAGGYNALTIAGTKAALRKLAGIIPDKYFAESQREAKANTGNIATWEGNQLMVIPQTLKSGTFELALDDSMLVILGTDVKPIKLEFYGDTRTDMDTTGKKYNDMTVDMQVQTAFGMGLVLPPYFGVFHFA